LNTKLLMSSSPHIRSEETVNRIMLDVIIALVPAGALGVFFFGPRALMHILITVAACVASEWAYTKLTKRPNTITDLSAIVTGILLAFNLPVAAPLWIGVVGGAFAIIVVKQFFGGLGHNFMNPALAARAFLFSWAVIMTTWTAPHTKLPLFATPATDAISTATPLVALKAGMIPADGLFNLFIGNVGGCIGETSALALLVGGVYLVIRKVISVRTPLAFILTVAVLTLIFAKGNNNFEFMLAHVLSGGLMLGAIFMATDYATTPVTKRGQIIFGIGCGLITVFIRYFGSYPEGVSYSILLMNCCVWLIEKFAKPKPFGEVSKKK